jgi:hypothetical protein
MSGWVLPLCHQVSLAVVLAPLFDPELPELPELPVLAVPPVVLLLLHAAIVTAAATAIATTTAGLLELPMGSHLLMMPGL